MARLTRAQRRQQTRDRLLDAAGQVFARRGFHAATVDEVADAAGYTKGAVYSNFATKDALFLALLDQRLAAQLQQVEALYAIESSEELLAALRGRTEQEFAAARDFGVLMVEFSLYAMRHPAAQAATRPPRPCPPSTWPRWRSPPTPACSSSTPPSQARSPGSCTPTP
jgi:AcrR family transcriptional regulator